MFRMVLSFILALASIEVAAQSAAEYLKMAEQAYNDKQNDRAKELYEKAASLGNADAHFALAYKYVVTRGEAIYHYSEAAKKGHSDATNEVLEHLFFRSNSLSLTDPWAAYDVYLMAKTQNPSVEIFDESVKIETLKKCIEAGVFDANGFIAKYKITEKDTVDNYSIWELANLASKGGRFGAANAKLTMQLVCRGGGVPAELEIAVKGAYNNWKSNNHKEFKPCDYVGSGVGLAYCSNLAAAESEKQNLQRIKSLAQKLKNNAGVLLDSAYSAAATFIELKAFNEEGHGGTGRVAWANGSADKQKASYLNFVLKANSGFTPKLDKKSDYDKQLNITYKKIMAELKQKPIEGGFVEITDEDVRQVQKAWIKYRDTSSKLFFTVNPAVSEKEWKDYLTKIRTQQIKDILALRE